MKSAPSLVFACVLTAGFTSVSHGLGIRISDQDARATARGDAFTATADNPSAIYYNPAGISFLYSPSLNSPDLALGLGAGKGAVPASPSDAADSDSGLRTRLGLYSITLGNEVRLAGSNSSFDISHRWQAVPNFYATWKQGGSPVTFGLGVYAPYGFGIWYPENSPIRAAAISGSVSYFCLNPVLSYKFTDSLSLAVGPTINYGRAALKQGIPVPGTTFPIPGAAFEFEGDAWGVGANAGLMWRPHPMHSFGVMYRSQTDLQFDGHSTTYIPGLVNSRVPANATGFIFPQNVVAGYSFRPTKKWNFEVNVDWTDWASLKNVTLHTTPQDITLPFNWQSSLFYEFGASYAFDNGFTASLGYIYSENSVPNNSFNPLIPDSNRHIFSAGVGKQWKNWDFDIAYQYALGQKRTVSGTPGGIADGTYQFDSHAISVSAGYKF